MAREGIEAVPVESGHEALRLLGDGGFDAVVSDYELVDMNGLQVLRRMRDSGDDTPFIVLTGRSREDVVIEALNDGADAYVQKGGSVEGQFLELVGYLRHIRDRRDAERLITKKRNRILGILDSMTDCFMLVGGDMVVVYANTAMADVAGVPLDGLVGRDVREAFPSSRGSGIEGRVGEVLRTGEMITYDVRYEIDGVERFFQSRMHPEGEGVAIYMLDVTEQVDKDREIEHHRRRLEMSMRVAKMGYWDWDVVNDTTLIDDSWVRYLGHDSLGQGINAWMSIVHPEDRPPGRAAFDAVVTGNDTVELEHRIIKGDGEPLWVLTIGRTIDWTTHGEPARIVGIQMDIDERKRYERELTESEEKFRELVKSAGVSIISFDPELNITFFNDVAQRTFGFTEEEVVGRSIFDTIFGGERDDELYSRILSDLRESPESYIVGENENVTKDGTGLWMSWSVRAMVDEGELCGILAIGSDVTDRHVAEVRLKESLEKYGSIINDVLDPSVVGITIIAPDLRVVHANQKMEEYFGVSWSRMIGRDIRDVSAMGLMDTLEDPSEYARLIASEPKCLEGTMLHILPGPERQERWLSYNVQPIRTGHFAGGRSGVYIDVTDQKRAEQTLQLANRKLNLLGAITRHDVLNQLTVLGGNVELLGAGCERVEDVVERISRSASRIRKDIEFTRLYEELGERGSEWINAGNAVRNPTTNNAGRLFIDLDLDHLELDADPLIEKVFHNLIDNSVTHGGKGTKMHVYMQDWEGGTSLVFEDNGDGIPEDEKESIFRYGYGTRGGMGLFLSREILSTTDMDITENGIPGEGARFEILVPYGRFRVVD